jgi:3-phosphoshikimate 1-carboxyvinyltransferase
MVSFEFDATDCPDLFPVLSVLAACCRGESYIRGVHRLFTKESNRAESIGEMLENFDVPYAIEDDTLAITGVKKLRGTVIDAHNDHRIAMAAAIGALRAGSRVDIVGAEAVNKSYPAFFNDLQLCGARCNFID